MNLLKKIWSKSSFGQLTVALFAICVVSGIFLAIPFDIANPYESISLLMIANPAASLFRNLHYWSAQLFLVFSLLHIWEHLKKNQKIKLNKIVWFRLSIGVLVIFLVMLTGFLLKADADSQQARQILNSLLAGIPFLGKILAYSLLGNENSLQVVYVHHIATFSIFIAIIILEHHRKIWPRWREFVWTSLFLLFLSYFISAPLHGQLNPTVKGPWYFLGLQEILHWLTIPELSLLVVFLFIFLIYTSHTGNKKSMFATRRSLLILSLLYLLLTITGLFFRGQNWQLTFPFEKNYSYQTLPQIKLSPIDFQPNFSPSQASASPTINGHKESCMVCHNNVKGFTESHNPQTIGCYSCHGGNPFQSDKNRSHENMLLVPGNLADASRSCGTANCHPGITERIGTSLMSNLSGMISVDRFVFNEQNNPDILTSVETLGNSPADEHLKNLCVRCHLGNPKTEPEPVNEFSRGGGCIACHLNYDTESKQAFFKNKNNPLDTTYLNYHPAISLQVTDGHCFGCHSRSGRISTNYEGWHETILQVDEMPVNDSFRLVEETRVFTYVQEDVHHKLGLSCIDCHNSYELMGDGNLYAHQENQVTIQCQDCHLTGKPNLISQKNLDSESAIIAALRFGNNSGKQYLATKKRNIPLINTYYNNDSAFLIAKNNKTLFTMKKPAEICTRGTAHDALSCSACHTSWAPSCIGCHNEYDFEEVGYNMLTNREQKGTWVEFIGEYNAYAPALGKRVLESKNGESSKVIPVVPGMVLTIDLSSFTKSKHDSLIFKRLFAPSSPHTTTLNGRDCKSCHNNPVALGYGKGKLEFSSENGKWSFKPAYQNNPNDGLPEDAWIGFLQERSGQVSTRTDLKPFSLEEQKNILTVGACLTCHKDNSKVMLQSLDNFDYLINKKSLKCIVPVW